MGRNIFHLIWSLKALFCLSLASREEASLGVLLQCVTALIVKNFLSRLTNASSPSLSSQDRCFSPLALFVALLWACSSRTVPFQCRTESLPSTCWPHFFYADQDDVVDVALGVWTFGLFRVCVQLRKCQERRRERGFFLGVTWNRSLSQRYMLYLQVLRVWVSGILRAG